jgi:hypothetical protein
VPQVFPTTQAEPGFLEGEDRGEPEKGPVGERKIKEAGVEGDPDQRVSAAKAGISDSTNPEPNKIKNQPRRLILFCPLFNFGPETEQGICLGKAKAKAFLLVGQLYVRKGEASSADVKGIFLHNYDGAIQQ